MEKQNLQTEFKELLEKELTYNRVPSDKLLIARNFCFAETSAEYNFYSKIAYGSLAPFLPSDEEIILVLKKILHPHQKNILMGAVKDMKVDLPKTIYSNSHPSGSDLDESIIDSNVHKLYLRKNVCFVCGRELTNSTSVENGVGPVCINRLNGLIPGKNHGDLILDADDWGTNNELSSSGKSIKLICRTTTKTAWVSLKGVIHYNGFLIVKAFYVRHFDERFNLDYYQDIKAGEIHYL